MTISLESSFEKATQDGTIPGAVLMASDRTGIHPLSAPPLHNPHLSNLT